MAMKNLTAIFLLLLSAISSQAVELDFDNDYIAAHVSQHYMNHKKSHTITGGGLYWGLPIKELPLTYLPTSLQKINSHWNSGYVYFGQHEDKQIQGTLKTQGHSLYSHIDISYPVLSNASIFTFLGLNANYIQSEISNTFMSLSDQKHELTTLRFQLGIGGDYKITKRLKFLFSYVSSAKDIDGFNASFSYRL